MTDFFGKISDALKLPARAGAIAAIVAAALIFMPPDWRAMTGISPIVDAYRGAIAIVGIAGLAVVIVDLVRFGTRKAVAYRKLRRKRREHEEHVEQMKRSAIAALDELDPNEMAVLREFIRRGLNTIDLPIDEATVAGLNRKGIIVVVANQGNVRPAGFFIPCKIADVVREHLEVRHIGLPEKPTDDDFKRLPRAPWIGKDWMSY